MCRCFNSRFIRFWLRAVIRQLIKCPLQYLSVTDSKSDEKLNKAFDELIKTTNDFNGNNVTWGQQHAENLAKLKAGYDEYAINTQPKFESLQKGLQKSKEIGNTYKEVDTERDNVLAVLDELMPVYKELKSYTDSKAYLNDGKAKGNELAAKYVAAVEKFNAAYDKLGEVINTTNKEKNKKKMEQMKKDGYKNYAAVMEATLRLTDLVEKVQATYTNPDKAAIEKEIGEIQALLNGIDTKDSHKESLVRNFNDTVGAIRQVMVDPNDKYQDRNLNRMIQQYNSYIDSYNRTKPDDWMVRKNNIVFTREPLGYTRDSLCNMKYVPLIIV